MDYSIDQLTTVEECDAVLEILASDKEVAESKLTIQRISIERHEAASQESFSELETVEPLQVALQNMVDTMPEGAIKDRYLKDLDRLAVRKRILSERVEQYSKEDLLLKQLEYNRMENDLPLYDALVQQVQNKKATL
jgi:HD superfamily phosphodiesterase